MPGKTITIPVRARWVKRGMGWDLSIPLSHGDEKSLGGVEYHHGGRYWQAASCINGLCDIFPTRRAAREWVEDQAKGAK